MATEIGNADWPISLAANYEVGNSELSSLYSKAAGQQWNAEHDIDWNFVLDPANPLKMPDETMELHGTDLWRRLGERERDTIRHHLQGWRLSQILHGEQASVLCAAKIAQGQTDMAAKLCACVQMMDEARHVEVYRRLLSENFSATYPLDVSLRRLLSDILRDRRHDITSLGFQILVEGLALASFRRIGAYSQEPSVRAIFALVLKDEARHFAAGRLMFRAYSRNFSDSERAEREEFVCEASIQLYNYLFADEIWERLGLPTEECRNILRHSQKVRNVQRSLFRQLVPAIRDVGLLGARATKVFEELQVMEYASLPFFDFHQP